MLLRLIKYSLTFDIFNTFKGVKIKWRSGQVRHKPICSAEAPVKIIMSGVMQLQYS